MINPINSIGIIFICILASLLRIVFRDNDSLIYIVSFINLVSLWYVLLYIFNSSIIELKEKLELSSYTVKVQSRKILFSKISIYIILGISALIGTLYFIYWHDETANDVIAIISLGGSLITNDISKWMANMWLLKK